MDNNYFNALARKAALGDAEAQFLFGKALQHGDGIEIDLNAAFKWYKLAAEQGHLKAQNNLALCYINGEGTDVVIETGIKWLEQAANQNCNLAQLNLGTLYLKGEIIVKDVSKGAYWLDKSLQLKGDSYNDVLNGVLELALENSENKELHKYTFRWFKIAAEHDIPEAQLQLAGAYLLGSGVKVNLNEAFNWCQKAAEKEIVEAELLLALFYKEGIGTKIDLHQYFKWMKLSAEHGNVIAQLKLAMFYYNGDGIEQNYEEAFKWWAKAAEQKNPYAMYNLGIMYRDGVGVEEDLFNAMYWFRKAHHYELEGAENAMHNIRLWIVRDGDTTSEETSKLYTKDIEQFIKEKDEKIDQFIADCVERKKYKPETFTDIESEGYSLTIYLDNYPGPTSVRKKGFKEFLLSNLLVGRANRLWEWKNHEWAYAYLNASLEVIKELSEPWVPHEWARYYSLKGEFYMQEEKWEKAEMAFRDYLGYEFICNMSRFAMDDENIYEKMSQDEFDDFCSSEWALYDRYVSLMVCLIQQNKMEEALGDFADLYSFLENRIKRQDSYVVNQWILNELKNEANIEVQSNLIRTLKQFGLEHVWAFCSLFCEKLEKEMNENGVGNGYQWSREQYEVVEQMFSFALPYIEQSPQDNLQKLLQILLTIFKGEYLMQTHRFVLAETEYFQGLEMIKNKLEDERTEEDIELLAAIIGLFNDLYSVQNQRTEKLDYLRSLMKLFTDDEKEMDCYLELCKKFEFK